MTMRHRGGGISPRLAWRPIVLTRLEPDLLSPWRSRALRE